MQTQLDHVDDSNAHVLKQSGRRPHRCLRHRATIGAARDYLGDARSITPPPLPLPGAHEQAISVGYLWRAVGGAGDRRRASGTMQVRRSIGWAAKEPDKGER